MPTIFAKILNIYELGRGGHNCFALDLFGNEPGTLCIAWATRAISATSENTSDINL